MSPGRECLLWIALILAAGASIWADFEIVQQALIVGSNVGGWTYGYLQPARFWSLAIAVISFAVAWSALISVEHFGGERVWRALLWCLVVGVFIQALLRSLTPFSLKQMFMSEGANAFYGVTLRHRPSVVLREFSALRQSWPLHAQSNMPGKIMLIYAFEVLSRSPGTLVWMIVLVSSLGAVLMYSFVRNLFEDATIALWSAILYLLVPGKLFFLPLMNVVTPVIVLLCACLLQQWVGTRRPVVAALFGAALYALAFFEPLPLVTGILFAALLLRAIMRGTISWREVTFHGVVALAAFGLTYVIVRVGTGFDLVQAFREITAHALAFNRSTGRPYSIWVRQNLWDIAFGMGVCQAVLIPVALGDSLMESYHTRQLTPAAVVTTALLVVLVLIDLLGVNRGEVVRLWIFLACLLQIPAAYVCFRLKSRLAIAIVIACTLIESALGTAMIGFVLPV